MTALCKIHIEHRKMIMRKEVQSKDSTHTRTPIHSHTHTHTWVLFNALFIIIIKNPATHTQLTVNCLCFNSALLTVRHCAGASVGRLQSLAGIFSQATE